MLLLVLFLGMSVIAFFINEGTSETYRCPYCAQIEVGPYHRLKCSLLTARKSKMPVPSEAPPNEYFQAANRDRLSTRQPQTVPDGYRSRIVPFMHGIFGPRSAGNGTTASLGRHLHAAP